MGSHAMNVESRLDHQKVRVYWAGIFHLSELSMKKNKQNSSVLMQGLESRTLMSAGIAPGAAHGRGGPGPDHGPALVVNVIGPCGQLGMFMPTSPNDTVKADIAKLETDKQTLKTDIRALTDAQKQTLQADEKAIRAAIEVLKPTSAPLETTLKTDLQTWTKTIFADQQAIRLDTKNGTDATADQAKLKADQAAGLAAVTADRAAIHAVIDADPGVIAARQQLATDLPTIATDQATIKA